MLDTSVQGDASGHRLPIPTKRVGVHITSKLRRRANGCRKLELLAMQQVDRHTLASTESPRALRHRRHHGVRVCVGGRPAQGDEHGIGGDKLLYDVTVISHQATVILGGRLSQPSGHRVRLSCDVQG